MKKSNSPQIHYPCEQVSRVTQVFGVNREDYAKFNMDGHDGIDYGLPVGSNLYSVSDGRVSLIQIKTTGYGRLVVVQHDGFRSYYGHNSEFRVQLGEQVTAGRVVGLSGGDPTDRYSGNSTGPHLHFEIRPDGVPSSNGYGGAVDPLNYLLNRYFMPAQSIGVVTAWAGLNVRNKPSVSGSVVLQKLRKGTSVEIWSIDGNWAKVRSLRNEYLHKSFLKVTDIRSDERKEPDPYTIDRTEAISRARISARAEAISDMEKALKKL